MGYIYRLPVKDGDTSLEDYDLKYLSVKKFPIGVRPLEEVAIYGKTNRGEGILGLFEVMEKPTTSSDIDPEKKIEFLYRSYFQVKVRTYHLSLIPLIELRHLRHFPSYNRSAYHRKFNTYMLYESDGLQWEYRLIKYRYPFDFCMSIGPPFFGDRYWRKFIHHIREKSIDYSWHKVLPQQKGECAGCGVKSQVPYFLEIHDTVKIDFDVEYKPIQMEDFIVLCPNCHKKEHHKSEE